ncbi:MAG TPA: hypothetical protein VK552_22215 [Reyranella sp.]|nr:hypothetical protein [Reyranella sp.]
MTDPSFYYAIFKKFQAVTGGNVTPGFGHVNDDASPELDGGFSLLETQDQYGLYGHLGPHASDYIIDNNNTKLNSAQQPLNALSNDPMQNPLFVMLKASLTPGGAPGPGPAYFVTVNNQEWPVMPPPGAGGAVTNATWKEFNTIAPLLIDAFESWISNGKIDDAPKGAPLSFAAVTQAGAQLKPFPGLSVNNNWPLLFVASMPGDDGRRHGDHAVPDVPIDHVPPAFWASSQVFLTYPTGVPGHLPGTIAFPPALQPGEEYYVSAVIGNAGNWGAGRSFQAVPPHMFVQGDALAFNTFMSPSIQLPSLSNLDPQSINQQYEQYFLAKESYDVAGFRFNVDKVFAGLKAAMAAAGLTPAQLGGLSIEDWLKGSHPCVKIRITAGENNNSFKPAGNPPPPLTLDSNPRVDRRIAQRNLAPFDMTLMAIKKPMWKNFIVAQAGTGVNGLSMQHNLPLATVQVLIAIPRQAYERYIDPKTSKGGAMRGFEPVDGKGREAVPKPFPDAVILQQTSQTAEIQVADHGADHGLGRERYFGMAIGFAGDPARLRDTRLGDIAVAHTAQDGIVGGFTLRPLARR